MELDFHTDKKIRGVEPGAYFKLEEQSYMPFENPAANEISD